MITFRHALAESRNIPALKVTERVGGIKTVIEYARKFGITSPLPAYLPIALGAADITLAEQTAAFTTFPNDGVRVMPRYIRKVTDYDGRVLEENYPEVRDVVSARTARIMVSMLREVILHGTGFAASKLNHPLGGKTGTTNDFTDAWFVGFSPSLTCGVWVGFDEKKTLGNKETGAMAALPIWIDFMRVALEGTRVGRFCRAAAYDSSAVAQKVDTPDVRPPAIARRTDAALLPLRGARAGAGRRVHGFGADRDALRDSRPSDHDSQARRHDVPCRLSACSADHGLVLDQGDRFFSSDVPPGRIMSQVPAPGEQVRRGWHVRVAESMGPQRVVIPDLIGGSERAAEINIRRRGLELGSVATATIPGAPTDQIVAQSPPANAVNVSAPTDQRPAGCTRGP